jgi:beta-lactam-binding protein with PASTA domain
MAGIVEDAGYEIKISIPTEHNQKGRVFCPNIIGMTSASAQSAITGAGLTVGTISLTTGVVTKQNALGHNWSLDGDSVDFTLTS